MRTLSCALLLAAVAAAQSFDEWLPDNTVFYVSIENVSRTKERWEKSRLAALWKDEAVQAFLAKPRTQWAAWMEKLQKEAGFSPDDVLGVLSGQAALAGVWPKGAEEPVALLIADVGENGEKVRAMLATEEKQLVEEKGFRRDEEEFHGVKIVSYAKENESQDAWLLDGSTFALAENVDLLKDLLARKGKGEGTLASRELYRRTRGRLGARSAEFFLYVDGPNLFQGLLDSGETDEKQMGILGAFGITAIESVAAEFAIEEKGLALRMFLAVKGEKTGFLRLLGAKNSALMPPRYAPADALSAGAWTLDAPGLFEEVRKIVERVNGSTEKMDAWFAGLKQQTGVDVPADIISSLGTELAFHSLAPAAGGDPSGAPGAQEARFVVSIQLKDKERLEAAVEKLLTAFGMTPVTQEYLGVKVHKVPTFFGVPVFACLPDRLVFSMSADDVKDVIARYGKEAKGMLDREDVAKALAGMPAQRLAVSVDDMPKSLATSSSTLAQLMDLVEQSGEAPEVAGFIDFSLFPSAEVLAKYLGMNTGCLVNEEDGVSYVSVITLVGG